MSGWDSLHIICFHTSLLCEGELGAQAKQESVAYSSQAFSSDNRYSSDHQAQDEYVETENSFQCRRKDPTLSYWINVTVHHANIKKLKKLWGGGSFCNDTLPQPQGKRVTWIFLLGARTFWLLCKSLSAARYKNGPDQTPKHLTIVFHDAK